jgi:hypothetical protein
MGRKCRRNNKRGDRKVGQAIVTWTVQLDFRDLKLIIPADACIIQVMIDSLGKSDCASPSMSMNPVSTWLRDILNPDVRHSDNAKDLQEKFVAFNRSGRFPTSLSLGSLG